MGVHEDSFNVGTMSGSGGDGVATDNNLDHKNMSTVFELSAAALSPADRSAKQQDRRRQRLDVDDDAWRYVIEKPCTSSPFPPPTLTTARTETSPLVVQNRWVPPTIAPEAALSKALQCSTLIISSPSFGPACARRLFSRIGRRQASCERTTGIGLGEPAGVANPQSRGRRGGGGERGREQTTTTAEVNAATRAVLSRSDLSDKTGQRGHQEIVQREGNSLTHILLQGVTPLGNGGLLELSSAVREGFLPRLVTVMIGGPGCSVGARGVTALAKALSSSPGCCSALRYLSLSHCCLGRTRERSSTSPVLAHATAAEALAAHAAWDCFFRHLQRLSGLSSLSLQNCGLDNGDIRSASITIQILPSGMLRCLRLSENRVSAPGLRILLRALTSRKATVPALWLRRQRPPIAEAEAREIVQDALFKENLFAEVRR